MNKPASSMDHEEPSPSLLAWEQAYARFETPQQEIDKFIGRIRRLQADRWPLNARILELFCGRGNGIKAWRALGYINVEGLDLSSRLIGQYDGPATLHIGDARDLPFDDASFDAVAVQGGLHHLSTHEDVVRCLGQMARVVKPGGSVLIVEPWQTPFLNMVHTVSSWPWARRAWPRLDALATMIEHERETYERWLADGDAVLEALRSRFTPVVQRMRYGKLMFVGRCGEEV